MRHGLRPVGAHFFHTQLWPALVHAAGQGSRKPSKPGHLWFSIKTKPPNLTPSGGSWNFDNKIMNRIIHKVARIHRPLGTSPIAVHGTRKPTNSPLISHNPKSPVTIKRLLWLSFIFLKYGLNSCIYRLSNSYSRTVLFCSAVSFCAEKCTKWGTFCPDLS